MFPITPTVVLKTSLFLATYEQRVTPLPLLDRRDGSTNDTRSTEYFGAGVLRAS